MSGRVYGLTHTAAAHTRTRTYAQMKKWMLENAQRNLQKQTCILFGIFFFLSERDKTRTIQNLTPRKANKHSCFAQNRRHT